MSSTLSLYWNLLDNIGKLPDELIVKILYEYNGLKHLPASHHICISLSNICHIILTSSNSSCVIRPERNPSSTS